MENVILPVYNIVVQREEELKEGILVAKLFAETPTLNVAFVMQVVLSDAQS